MYGDGLKSCDSRRRESTWRGERRLAALDVYLELQTVQLDLFHGLLTLVHFSHERMIEGKR